ncbi:MAG: hypothetical protein M0C28_07810 [Candidatus Moduliflexus flocculans]|nr:hypothetical protein [Candidatus Moduliflexus flocculans]
MTNAPSRPPRLRAGRPFPLGATVAPGGVNFAIYSRHAAGVRLLLFDSPGSPEPAHDLRLQARSAFVWHVFVEGLGPGALYAYRVEGPYRPQIGDRFNAAQGADRSLRQGACTAISTSPAASSSPTTPASPHGDLSFDPTDDCAFVPRCVVVDDALRLAGRRAARSSRSRSSSSTRCTSRGFTAPPSRPAWRSPAPTSGFIEKIPHLKSTWASTRSSCSRSTSSTPRTSPRRDAALTNYWGYNTIAFFAPDRRLRHRPRAAARRSTEFKTHGAASCTAPASR